MSWGAAIGSAVGGLAGASLSFAGKQISEDFAKKQASKQRHFARAMYETRYQTTMEDMVKAGLNPILATPGIGGIPGTSAARPAGPIDTSGLSRGVSSAVTKGLEAKLLKVNYQKIKAEWFRTEEEGILTRERAAQVRLQNILTAADIPSARAQLELDETAIGRRSRQWEILRKRFLPFGNTRAPRR